MSFRIGKKISFRPVSLWVLILVLSGCGIPDETRVDSTVLTFSNHSAGVLTFDAQVCKGDSLCWQHGDDGTEVENRWVKDRIIVLTISKSADQLSIDVNGNPAQSIPVEKVTLIENPELTDGKYHVANYVRKLGVARTTETPLYVYVKEEKTK